LSVFVQNHGVGRRIIKVTLLIGLLAVASGCVRTQKLDNNSDKIGGRPVAVLSNSPVTMKTGTDLENGLAAGQSAGVGLAIGLVDTAFKASTGTYERSVQVAHPAVDPARIVEEKLLSNIASGYRATPSSRISLTVRPVERNGGWPDKSRVVAIAAGAKAKGFDGLVVDVVPIRYQALTQGHGLTIGGPKVVFSYIANFALIDAENGKLLASGFCMSAPASNTHKLNAVLEGGQTFVNAQIRQIADRCASEISRKALKRG
jgi:hypothetical protein